jgi:hypothetical protein
MNASAPLPVTTRSVGRTALAPFGAAKTRLTRLWFRIRSLAPRNGLVRRSSMVKPALAKGTLQISLQALRLSRVVGGECINHQHSRHTAAASDVSTLAGIMPPCRDEAIPVWMGRLRTFGAKSGGVQWEHSPILLRVRVGCCTQPHCWQNLCACVSREAGATPIQISR